MTINDFEIVNDEIKKYYGTDKVLELPKSIKSIGVEAFKNCFDIEKIILNEGIKKIDKQALYHSLRSLTCVQDNRNVILRGETPKNLMQ